MIESSSKTIFIASDHAGFNLKSCIINHFLDSRIKTLDLGCNSADISVDYPDFAKNLCDNLLQKKANFGILICGSGIGMSIAANRNKQIRAALCFNVEMAKLARKHNDANVLCIGSRLISQEEALSIIEAFMSTKFDGERHEIRVNKISQ